MANNMSILSTGTPAPVRGARRVSADQPASAPAKPLYLHITVQKATELGALASAQFSATNTLAAALTATLGGGRTFENLQAYNDFSKAVRTGLIEARHAQDVMNYAIKHPAASDDEAQTAVARMTEETAQKAWERAVKNAGFSLAEIKPKSEGEDAKRKAEQRAKADAEARALLARVQKSAGAATPAALDEEIQKAAVASVAAKTKATKDKANAALAAAKRAAALLESEQKATEKARAAAFDKARKAVTMAREAVFAALDTAKLPKEARKAASEYLAGLDKLLLAA